MAAPGLIPGAALFLLDGQDAGAVGADERGASMPTRIPAIDRLRMVPPLEMTQQPLQKFAGAQTLEPQSRHFKSLRVQPPPAFKRQ